MQPNSLRTADAFPVVASLRSDDRKCVCCSQASNLRMTHSYLEFLTFDLLKSYQSFMISRLNISCNLL